MKYILKQIGLIQIVGFIISATISTLLILRQIDTIQSLSLGLILAILTQLFAMQKKQDENQVELKDLFVLDQNIYQDEWLHLHLKAIVQDYFVIKQNDFKLFQHRAHDLLINCSSEIHSLAEGHFFTVLQSGYTLNANALTNTKQTVHAVSVSDMSSYWRSEFATDFIKATDQAIKRGVQVTRVFIEYKKELPKLLDILEQQRIGGVNVFVAFVEDTPNELIHNYLILDQKIIGRIELSGSGTIRGQHISIKPSDIDELNKQFQSLLRYAVKFDQQSFNNLISPAA